MMPIKKIIFFSALFFIAESIFADQSMCEEIIMIRHGEKPTHEIGQLNCKGLNRSLLLPSFFQTNFPAPQYIFAPNPADEVWNGKNQYFSYLRPLATIEPTAISLDLPVNTKIGFSHSSKLMNTLLESKYHHAVIYVAWEHGKLQSFAKKILTKFNNNSSLSPWHNNNYNRVYEFKIDWGHNPPTLSFMQTSENLHHISTTCPK